MTQWFDRYPWLAPALIVSGVGLFLWGAWQAGSWLGNHNAQQERVRTAIPAQPQQAAPVIVVQPRHDDAFERWMFWRAVTAPTHEVHEVHHYHQPAPAVPVPAYNRTVVGADNHTVSVGLGKVPTPPSKPAAAPPIPVKNTAPVLKTTTFTVREVPRAPVSAIKTSSSSARPMSSSSFRSTPARAK